MRSSSSRIFASLLVGSGLIGAIACGSRTGLFGPDQNLIAALDAGKDAGEDLDGAVPCKPGKFGFDLALTQLMFVIDRSGSMKFRLSGPPAEGTVVPRAEWRWTVFQNALRKTLPSFDQQIAMGAKFFPEEQTLGDRSRSCLVDQGAGLAPKRGNAGSIISTFDTTEPVGGTPTSEAVRLASQFLSASRSVARTIVLATDGAPNCNNALDGNSCICTTNPTSVNPDPCGTQDSSCLDDERTIQTIRTVADDRKIPVYVIGIGSTERPEFLRVLDQMAVAGGRPRPTAPRHYNVQSESDLTLALETIRDSVAKCTYLTPSAPVDPNRITVEINGVSIPRDQTKTNGWDWIDQAFGWLAFFGDACQQAQNGSTPQATGVSGVVSCD
jgi:hypothetical protein